MVELIDHRCDPTWPVGYHFTAPIYTSIQPLLCHMHSTTFLVLQYLDTMGKLFYSNYSKRRRGGVKGILNNVKRNARFIKRGIPCKSLKATQYFSDNYKGAPGFLDNAVETWRRRWMKSDKGHQCLLFLWRRYDLEKQIEYGGPNALYSDQNRNLWAIKVVATKQN